MTDDTCIERLEAHAASTARELAAQHDRWRTGHTRRSFLRGAGLVGVAVLGSQLVTSRAAFALASAGQQTSTVLLISLRGAADGLRTLIPASADLGVDYLRSVRPALVPTDGNMTPLDGAGGWALNNALTPLLPLWGSGELAFVPAAANTGATRSHFQAQRFLDSGGNESASEGWLDRLLTSVGPGTTFRAVGEGGQTPAQLIGHEKKIVLNSLNGFTLPSAPGSADRTAAAIDTLYRGLGGAAPQAVRDTLTALAQAGAIRGLRSDNGARYPSGTLGTALSDMAKLIKADVGVQVAALDVGGWDTHTAEVTQLDQQLSALATCLAAFMQDLGPDRRSRVTVVVSTEFGRRVAQNGSGGADHGHGGVMLLLGGGLQRSQVAGRWDCLSDSALDQGDVAGLNDPFQVFAEVATTRLGAGSTRDIFPGTTYRPLGLMRGN